MSHCSSRRRASRFSGCHGTFTTSNAVPSFRRRSTMADSSPAMSSVAGRWLSSKKNTVPPGRSASATRTLRTCPRARERSGWAWRDSNPRPPSGAAEPDERCTNSCDPATGCQPESPSARDVARQPARFEHWGVTEHKCAPSGGTPRGRRYLPSGNHHDGPCLTGGGIVEQHQHTHLA
jgi:hypothetical protein